MEIAEEINIVESIRRSLFYLKKNNKFSETHLMNMSENNF